MDEGTDGRKDDVSYPHNAFRSPFPSRSLATATPDLIAARRPLRPACRPPARGCSDDPDIRIKTLRLSWIVSSEREKRAKVGRGEDGAKMT